MLKLEQLEKILAAAAKAWQQESRYLCELDGVCGDGDHGLTMAALGRAVEQDLQAGTAGDIKALLEQLSDTCMALSGGSACPLWGSVFSGLAEGVEEGCTELDAAGFKAMLAAAKEDFAAVSRAKLGNKTMVDALYPALDAGVATEGGLPVVLAAMAQAARQGAEATAQMVAKFGRAKNLGERSLGSKDPGAESTAIFFAAMAAAL